MDRHARADRPRGVLDGAADLDWLIVGGGLHGVHAAVRLLTDGGVDPARLAIVDPARTLFERWRERTGALAMSYLRSPAVHNLGRTPLSLERFAGRRRDRALGLFAQPYQRPALALFDAHCDALAARHGLAGRHVRALVTELDPRRDRVVARTADGRELSAERAVLALGPGRAADRPPWARGIEPWVGQVLEPGFRWEPVAEGATAVVVGAGMTAVHAALRFAAEGAEVELIARHAPREYQFDTDPGWLGPKQMVPFERLDDLGARRTAIDAARRRGSITPDLKLALGQALRAGRIRWQRGEVVAARPIPDGAAAEAAELEVAGVGRLMARRVVLCTGFAPGPPSPGLVADLAERAGLPRSACGFPLVDRALRWHPRVHVTGALAELELGPTARNIAGARRAADRILRASRDATQRRPVHSRSA